MIPLRRLAKRLNVSPECAKGMAWGIGATITPVGTAFVVDEKAADRLELMLSKRPLPFRDDSRQPVG